MRSDILDKARKLRDALEREHSATVHKANVACRASEAKFKAAQKHVMDLEFAVISAEASIAADARRAR